MSLDDVLPWKLAKPLSLVAKSTNWVLWHDLSPVLRLGEVQNAAQEAECGIGLSFAVLGAYLQMPPGHQRWRDFVYCAAVPSLEVDVEVALIVRLGALCQLSDSLECCIRVRQRWYTFG